MLEILYDKDGNIIVAKKKPCVWGSQETNVVELDDPTLEAKMGSKNQMLYPYQIKSAYIVDVENVGESLAFEDLLENGYS